MEQEHDGVCHFSFWCDGHSDTPKNKVLWEEMEFTARQMFYTFPELDMTQGATHYHHVDILPAWATELTRVVQIDNHIFYRWE
jgi:spore germination cell wall hydrolase CwlJ-like protein